MRIRRLKHITEFTCETAQDWRDFVLHNKVAIIGEHGTIAEGKRLAQYGGMKLGGGAAPLCVVTVSRNTA